MTPLDVSIIIPTCNRAESLRQTLCSLAAEASCGERYEVVVVDDGSRDDTRAVARGQYPFPIHYIRQANRGSAIARNRGAREAQGTLLIFLDDDMLVDPGYVAALADEHRTHHRVVSMGVVRPYLPQPATPFARNYAAITAPRPISPEGELVEFTECVTNNLSALRDDFFEIGMMQDVAGDGPTWWGDVDFGYRAARLGFRFRCSGRAFCCHRDYSTQDLSTACRRAEKTAAMAVLLFKKHPDLQEHLPMFRDKMPIRWRHDSAALSVRKIGRSISALRPALSGMERAVYLLERVAPRPALLRPLYRWVISSYIYLGYRRGLREYGPMENR